MPVQGLSCSECIGYMTHLPSEDQCLDRRDSGCGHIPEGNHERNTQVCAKDAMQHVSAAESLGDVLLCKEIEEGTIWCSQQNTYCL